MLLILNKSLHLFCFHIYLINLIIPPCISWTDFSETRVIINGLDDLMNLSAFCPQYKYLRGLSLDHPTKTTIRWALQCLPFPFNLRTSQSDLHQSTRAVPCPTNNLSILLSLPILCPQGYTLVGFSLNKNSYQCMFTFNCQPSPFSFCSNKNTHSSPYAPFTTESLEKTILSPVIVNEINGAIQGIALDVKWDRDLNLWQAAFKYSYCLINEDSDFNTTSTIGVDIELFFLISDISAIDLIVEMYEIYITFKEYISFTPHYLINTTMKKSFMNDEDIKNNCINKGEYCLLPLSNVSDGYHLIIESVKQMCIHNDAFLYENYNKDLYWEYMILFKRECFKETLNESCGSELFELYNINGTIIKTCIEESFWSKGDLRGDNSIIKREFLISKERGIKDIDTPLLIVNGKKIDEMNVKYIKSILCDLLGDISQCKKVKEIEIKEEKHSFVFWFFIIVIVLLVLIYWLRKRKLRNVTRGQ